MTDLLNIAKECGALVMPKGAEVQAVTLKHAAVVLTPEELHATVEKVCGPLVDALTSVLNANEGYQIAKCTQFDQIQRASTTLVNSEADATKAIADYIKLMGQDK